MDTALFCKEERATGLQRIVVAIMLVLAPSAITAHLVSQYLQYLAPTYIKALRPIDLSAECTSSYRLR